MASKSSPAVTSAMNHRGNSSNHNKNKNNNKSHNNHNEKKRSTTTQSTHSGSSNKKPKYDTNTNHSKQQSHSHSSSQSSQLHPRKNADIVERGKRLWNQLRCKTNTTTQIRDYMHELFPLIQSKVMELTMQHDASRIVQAAIQFGNVQERHEIVQELCLPTTTSGSSSSHNKSNPNTTTPTTPTSTTKHTFLDVCQSQYAHFVVLKLLKYCYKDPICLQLLINAFKGNMMKLITHTNGCRIVEVLFQSNSSASASNSASSNSSNSHGSSTAFVIPKEKIAILKQEIYGPHYAVFAQDTLQQLVPLVQQQQQEGKKPTKPITYVIPTLALNIALLPDKKGITMDHIRNNIILKGIDKQLYGYYYFQEIMYEYIHVLRMYENYATIRDLTSTTSITDQTIHLLSSKFGANVVCQFIAYSTVKERKRIMKSCKGYTKSALFHKDAYLVLIRLLQCIDDTVVLYKNILQELLTYTSTSTAMTNSDTNTNQNTNTVVSISKSKEIVHSNGTANADERPVLLDIALSDTASKFLFVMLIPTTTATTSEESSSASITNKIASSSYTKIFNPYELEVLHPFQPYILEKVSPTNTSNDGSGENNDTGTTITITKNGRTVQKVYTSKKDPELRRLELLQYFHVPLLQQLCSATTKEEYVLELLRSVPGSNVLYHLYIATIQALWNHNHTDHNNNVPKKSNPSSTTDQLLELLKDMIRMICLVCRKNLSSSSNQGNTDTDATDQNPNTRENIFEHAVGHRMIKNLIMYDASVTTTKTNIPSFAKVFVQEFASDFQSMITYNRGAFILVALLQVSSLRNKVLEHLPVTTIVQPSDQNKSTTTSTAGLHALRQ